ncbi:MAG: hypothetical protein AAB969_02280 [Patescibacteria group bacterium]
MGLKNQEGLEKPMFTNRSEEKFTKSQRPYGMDLKLKIQAARDFAIAKALNEGRGSEVFEINNLPDEHFKMIVEAREKKK